MDILILLLIYLFSVFIGSILEKFRIPWLFAPLLAGILISYLNVGFGDYIKILGELGMYLLLFLIGYELNVEEIIKNTDIFISGISIILISGFLCSLLLMFFGYPLYVSLICGFSIVTVGEGVLLPILDEYNLVNTVLGNYIIGIGTLDDIIEVLTIFFASLVLNLNVSSNIFVTAVTIFLFISFGILLHRLKYFKINLPEKLFAPFAILIWLVFIYLGCISHLEALSALIAGIITREITPIKEIEYLEDVIQDLAYSFLVPIFFFMVGYSVNLNYVLNNPLMAIFLFITDLTAKTLVSYLFLRKNLGNNALIVGIGLSVKFSTSLAIANLLYKNKIIDLMLYSSLITASSISTLVMPLVFSIICRRSSVVRAPAS